MEPIFFRNFINTSVFNFDELNELYKNHPNDQIELLKNRKKFKPCRRDLVDYQSTLIFIGAAGVKEEFLNLKKVFELKFPQIKKATSWDVHIYSSYSGEAKSYNIHRDKADNIILQTEGLSKWYLPGFFDKTLSTGDMLWIPKETNHGCVPINRRISLSFAFWYF